LKKNKRLVYVQEGIKTKKPVFGMLFFVMFWPDFIILKIPNSNLSLDLEFLVLDIYRLNIIIIYINTSDVGCAWQVRIKPSAISLSVRIEF
jgi:hypothetical protein